MSDSDDSHDPFLERDYDSDTTEGREPLIPEPSLVGGERRDQSGSRLCSLPVELRSTIWELILSNAGGRIRTLNEVLRLSSSGCVYKGPLDLLAACRMIYEEAAPIYYLLNDIHFRGRMIRHSHLHAPFGLTCLLRLSGIRSITVNLEGRDMREATIVCKHLRHLPRLEKVRLIGPQDYSGTTSKREELLRAVRRMRSVQVIRLVWQLNCRHEPGPLEVSGRMARVRQFQLYMNGELMKNMGMPYQTMLANIAMAWKES